MLSSVTLPCPSSKNVFAHNTKPFLPGKSEGGIRCCDIGRHIPGDGRAMEAKNVSTQPRNSVEGRPLEVKAEGVVLASRRGESGAVVDEVNIVRRDGDEFEFCLELSVC